MYNVQAKHINDSSMLVQWSPLTSRGIAVNYQVYLKWKSDGKIYVRLMCVDSATRCLIRIEPKFPIPHVVFVKAQTTDLSTGTANFFVSLLVVLSSNLQFIILLRFIFCYHSSHQVDWPVFFVTSASSKNPLPGQE